MASESLRGISILKWRLSYFPSKLSSLSQDLKEKNYEIRAQNPGLMVYPYICIFNIHWLGGFSEIADGLIAAASSASMCWCSISPTQLKSD